MNELEDSPATKKDLAQLETRIDTKLSQLENRIDHKLDALETRIDHKLDALETRMDQKLDTKLSDLEDRLAERIRDSQTEILKGFLPWQESVHVQFRKLEVNMGNSVTAIQERMDILERRLWEIEKRLLLNPPAA